MTTTDGTSIVVERRIEARPATVFAFFTDPVRWLRWQGVEATVEAVPGGEFRMNVIGDGYASGRFVEIDPPRRIVFTWGWELPGNPVPPGSSTVEVDLEPDGPDGQATIVRLTHRGLPLPAARDQHRGGWEHYLGRLAEVATGRDAGRDPWVVST